MMTRFGWHVPEWLLPAVTILIIGVFWWKSKQVIRGEAPLPPAA